VGVGVGVWVHSPATTQTVPICHHMYSLETTKRGEPIQFKLLIAMKHFISYSVQIADCNEAFYHTVKCC
jgi:hypothetical protein